MSQRAVRSRWPGLFISAIILARWREAVALRVPRCRLAEMRLPAQATAPFREEHALERSCQSPDRRMADADRWRVGAFLVGRPVREYQPGDGRGDRRYR